MAIEIEIKKIIEDEFIIRNESISKINEKKLSIGFKVSFDYDIEIENFTVKLLILYSYDLNEKSVDLVRFSTSITFKVIGLKSILKVENKMINLPDDMIGIFTSTAISTSRGMLAYRLAGTILAEYYIPLVNLEELLSHLRVEASKKNPKAKRKPAAKRSTKMVK